MLSEILTVFNRIGIPQSISFQKSNRIYTLTVVGIFNVDTIPNSITLSELGKTLTLSAFSQKNRYQLLTYSFQETTSSDEIIKKTIIFKVMDEPIYNFLKQTNLLAETVIRSSINTPIDDYVIKSCPNETLYLCDDDPNCAFTPREILLHLGIQNITYPFNLDYSITEFTVRAGTTVQQLLNILFPIYGLKISKTNGFYYVELPDYYYVESTDDVYLRTIDFFNIYLKNKLGITESELSSYGFSCVLNKAYSFRKVKEVRNSIVRGLQSEPRNYIPPEPYSTYPFQMEVIEEVDNEDGSPIEIWKIKNIVDDDFAVVLHTSKLSKLTNTWR